ncbi:hypothetical protein C7212DRAFT_191624, partial [Tuber magnatum]
PDREGGEEPSLIDLDSDPKVNDTTRAPSRSLGSFSGLPISSQFINEANPELGDIVGTPHLLDEYITEDLPAPTEPDGLPFPSPQRFLNFNLPQVVPEAPREEYPNEIQPQEPLHALQDDSQATSIHGEDSAESISEDVAQGIDSENTDRATTEPPSNGAPNPQIPIIIVKAIDEPSPPPPTAPIQGENHSGEDEMVDNSSEGDDDSDIFEDAPQTPSDIIEIPGGQEAGKPEDEHPGIHHPLPLS